MKALIAAALVALVLPAAGGAHETKFTWTEYDATQRLTVGKFAASNGVKYAECLGTGVGAGPSYARRFKHFECKLQDAQLEKERQIVLHVRGETTFTVQWLTTKEC